MMVPWQPLKTAENGKKRSKTVRMANSRACLGTSGFFLGMVGPNINSTHIFRAGKVFSVYRGGQGGSGGGFLS